MENTHNKGLATFYSTPNVVRKIRSKRMKWLDYLALMNGKGSTCEVLV
jgi:hypothetical protein